MSTSANIRHLRATKGMTQEQLAMLVGVSRQAVAKWEAGGTYPETEKLIRLAQIFECSLDELVSGDLTSRPVAPDCATPASSEPQDVCGYDQEMRSFAARLALGVAAIVGGIGGGLVLECLVGPIRIEGLVTVAFVFLGVIAGVLLIVPASIHRASFNRAHPFVEDFYTPTDRESADKLLGWGIGGGMAFILAGTLGAVVLDGYSEYAAAGTLLTCIAIGVGIILYAALMHSRLDVESYNLEIAEHMSEADIEAVEDAWQRGQLRLHKRRLELTGALCSACILAATIVGIILIAAGNEYAHLSWAVGGISCGIIAGVVKVVVKG